MLAVPVLLHLIAQAPDEPVYNGDSNRHVMTSIFFKDLLNDRPFDNPRQYAQDYYLQYPALGLLVWPPLFHGVTGLLMTVCGTSVWVPRLLVFACFVGCSVCLYRLTRRRCTELFSQMVVVSFSLLPMIFEFSRHVMLEMPTLALCLLCLERFDVWLSHQRPVNLYLAAVAAALAALTRFDAAMLLPALLLMAVFEGRWKLLLNRHVPIAAAVAVALLAPTYLLIWQELGELHVRQAAESVSGPTIQRSLTDILWFYPSEIPTQTGWPVVPFLAVGLLAAFRKEHRLAGRLFAAILIGTYVTFTPLAELTARHTIYWLPAIAWFAVVGVLELAGLAQRLTARPLVLCQSLTAAVLICSCTFTTFQSHVYRVTGYGSAASVVMQHTNPGDKIFLDGWWDGNLIYQIRHRDTDRSRSISRADKILYDFTNVPTVDFQQYVESDSEILEAILELAPRCIVFEDPQPFGDIPISRQFHALVRSLPQLFPVLDVIPVESTVPGARSFSLYVLDVDLPRLQQYLNRIQPLPERESTTLPKNQQTNTARVTLRQPATVQSHEE